MLRLPAQQSKQKQNMKKIINHAKQNPFDVIIPGILAIAIISLIVIH